MKPSTRLNNRDWDAIEKGVAREVAALGDRPTLESVKAMGVGEQLWLTRTLDGIRGLGRIVTLMVAELIQSAAALTIVVVFGVLEYWRVFHGAEALGQSTQQASYTAIAVVVANVVHPIYALRGLRGQEQRVVNRPTLRGWLESLGRRLFGKPEAHSVTWSHNPTLHGAAWVITWTTVILAVYDLIAPLLTSILTGTTTKPNLILIAELVMGLGLSIAGVFFLQSAAHEIGVRTLLDQPQRVPDVVAEKQQAYDQKVEAIRERLMAEHMAGKIADEERKAARKDGADASVRPFAPTMNGRGLDGHG